MPTFVFDNSAASNSGVILLEVPDLAWFNDSVLNALAEMTIPDNWRGDDEDYRKYALLQANLMMATYKVLNFNPFPVGMVISHANETPPPGYLLCDGANYTQDEYPELFNAIDYRFKHGDNFDVPDLRDRFVYGFQYGVTPFATTQDTNTQYLDVTQLPPHNHSDNGHSHSIQLTTDGLAVAPGELPVVVPIPIIPGSTGTSYADIANTGDGEGFDNRPSFIALCYCIYAGR